MKNTYSYCSKGLVLACALYMSAVMIISPTGCIGAAKEAISVCKEVVIPTLFPFIFCGNIFIELGAARIIGRYLSRLMLPMFNVSGAGAIALVLGIISGYPVGAICAASLYQSGECSKAESERLLAFCNNSGPMFIIGAIGTGMLGSHKIGVFLYIVHILSALFCGIIFKGYGKKENTIFLPPAKEEADKKTAALDIGAAVIKSVNTVFMICGFIITFAVFTNALPQGNIRRFLYPFLEITGGIKNIAQGDVNVLTLPVISFFTAFSGISVLCQVYGITKPAGLSLLPYFSGKLLQGIIAFALTLASIAIAGGEVPVFMPNQTYVYSERYLFASSVTAVAYSMVALLLLISVIWLWELMKNKARHRRR